jgi:hypothetical protein
MVELRIISLFLTSTWGGVSFAAEQLYLQARSLPLFWRKENVRVFSSGVNWNGGRLFLKLIVLFRLPSTVIYCSRKSNIL